MSTDWCAIFYETLAEYVQQYIEAGGDPVARVQILEDCREDIIKSPLHQEQAIELPQHLRRVIRKVFLPYLEDASADRKEEEEKLAQLEDGEEDLTPEEREAAARSTDAGDYWTPWDTFRVAQRIFADEVAQVDGQSRDKKDRKSFGNRTVAIRKWFNDLPRSKVEEAEKVAAKWNSEGAPNKEKMQIYRKKNLRNRTVEFIDALRRTMGVHCVVLQGYEAADAGIKALYIETNMCHKRDRHFTLSSNDCKAWAKQGAELLADFMTSEDEKEQENLSDQEEEDIPEVSVDASGHPILPLCHAICLKSRQDVVREIFSKAYMRITRRDKVRVPWLELTRTPTKYLDAETIPENFEVLDPSKLTKIMIGRLWSHWAIRDKKRLPILIFIKARKQDLGLSAELEVPRKGFKKRKAYVDVGSDEQSDGEELDGAGKGRDDDDTSGRILESSARPLSSKRPRLSQAGQPAVPEDESPAANDSDRVKFLYSLSLDPSYKTLLDDMLALPIFASPQSSSNLAPKSKLSLPVWASWQWSQTYLSPNLHAKRDEFRIALGLLRKCLFTDRNKGTPVVLGFGLLLRECWRAVEVEDEEHFPDFLRESVLGKERADQVIEAIKEVIGRLSSQGKADEETVRKIQLEAEREKIAQEEKKKDESKKVEALAALHQKKPASGARKLHANTSSIPVPPTSKDDNGPIKKIRSQRERKPSKKLLGYD